MPILNQAPQGTEQKLVFQTEEDRNKAMDAIPMEPPVGTTDLDSWRREQDVAQDAIEAATIDPNYVAGQPAPAPAEPVAPLNPAAPAPGAPAPAPGEGDWYKPENFTFTDSSGQTVTIGRDEVPEELRKKGGLGSAKDLVLDYVNTHRYAETKKQEYDSSLTDMRQQLSQAQQTIKDAEAKMAEMAKRPASPEEPGAAVAAAAPSDSEITTIQTGLNDILAQLEKIDDDDPDAGILSRKAVRLQAKLATLKDAAYNARFQAYEKDREKIKTDAEAARKEKERREQEVASEQARVKAKQEMGKSIEVFSNAADSKLKMSKPFSEVEQDYDTWATDVAATYFNIPANQVEAYQAEIAVQHFLNRTPMLMTKLTAEGKLSRTPQDLRKYLINTELYMMMKGKELDQATGKWVQHDWTLPDMDTAYERWKRKKGLKYQDEVTAANKAEEELLRIMNPPNVAEQVPAGQGPQAQRDMSKLSLPQAESIMTDLEKKASLSGYGSVEEWIETKRRKGPGDADVDLYDRADESLMTDVPAQ